jgi:hypothetical protein
MRSGARRRTIRHMRERERVRVPLPQGQLDRVLLALGAGALLLVVPVLWIWLLYGSGLPSSTVTAGAVGLCVLTAGVGAAMIRLLDGAR